MGRSCPVCENQPLEPLPAKDVVLDNCPKCDGLWFDAGELEIFPDRPTVKAFLAAARLAPGRCRRAGHRVPKGMVRCVSCGSDTVRCPACAAGLSMVSAGSCVIDVCTSCRGVWLDKGELELLAGVTGPQKAQPPPPPPGQGTWEIPSAAPPPAADPWAGPGSGRPLYEHSSGANPSAFGCHHCGAALTAYSAFAFDGETFCATCKPDGAVGSKDLPPDRGWAPQTEGMSFGRRRGRLGYDVVSALIDAVAWLLR